MKTLTSTATPAHSDIDGAIVSAEIVASRLDTFVNLLDRQDEYDKALFEAVIAAMCHDLGELKAAHEQIRMVAFSR